MFLKTLNEKFRFKYNPSTRVRDFRKVFVKKTVFFFLLPLFFNCQAFCGYPGDLKPDSKIDFFDFAIFASNWAEVSDVNEHAPIEWTSIKDIAGYRDRIYQVEIDSNDDVYAMASVSDPCDPNGLLAKYTTESNEPIWSIRVPYSHKGLALDANDYVYIGGSSIRKIDPNGSEIWSIDYDNRTWENVHIDSNRNIYATAEGDSNYNLAKFLPDNNDPVWMTGGNGWVVDIVIDCNDYIYVVDSNSSTSVMNKYASDSNQPIWTCDYESIRMSRLTKDYENNIIVTGWKGERWFDPNTKIVTVKHSPDSNIPLWTAEFYEFNEPDVTCWTEAIITDSNGNIYVSGVADYNGNWDFITIKYEPNGNQSWADKYDRAIYDCVKDIEVDGKGNIYVTGDTAYTEGLQDTFTTLKYNPEGGTIWEAHYYGPGGGRIVYEMESTAIDSQNNIYVGGSVGDEGDWITESQDYVLVKYKQLNCSEQLLGDFDRNCVVDYNDLAVITEDWLENCDESPTIITQEILGCSSESQTNQEALASEELRFSVTVQGSYIFFEDMIHANCCFGDFLLEMETNGNEITVYEIAQIKEYCLCMCDFPASATLGPFAEGEYLLEVIDVHGNSLGTIPVTIGGS
jgi:hypothetical protein